MLYLNTAEIACIIVKGNYYKMIDKNKISFAKAQSILNKFRYKPRKEWTQEDRVVFKLCNFAVLSKKRLNNVLITIQSLAKLSDKSHYKYNELDIKLIKELILDNLEICFKQFKQNINVIKESDMEQIHNHINKLKDENKRLENEIERLNFIIENFVSELKIKEILDIQDILKKKIAIVKKKSTSKNKKSDKLKFNQESIREFVKKWNEGYTTFEITESFKKIGVDLVQSKKKRYKL